MSPETEKDRPEVVVEEQFQAYNAGDLERFLAVYSEDAVLVLRDGKTISGKPAMRSIYAKFFADNPKLTCTIEKREISGTTVTDVERITGLANGLEKRARASYDVAGGLIRKVTFTDPGSI